MRRFGKVSALCQCGGCLRPKCGCPAANTRSPRSDGRHPAEARRERKRRLPQKAIPFRVRHIRRTPARRPHRRPPRGGRIQQAARQTDTAARHGSKHTVKGCGTPLSLAENRRARRRRKPFCVQYVRLRALLVTERKDGAAAARKAIAAAFCAPQTPRSGVFPLRASPAPSAIIIPYFGENDKDSSKDFSQIAKFYPSFIFFS